ncbi:putative cytochrome P450 monooxygenase [Coemansia spiralis]|uniref:Cytochrome P450 n=1 Tax=Coemansia umbellata TaxID=1424467 RepID=A0ABQ8PRD7_9FUNG|nr:putative cytochrome P450 monooxygenase [Coemansia spiralis]KAJ1992809.1 hypothetical protein EDC05_002593 [Coemansia umbellata]
MASLVASLLSLFKPFNVFCGVGAYAFWKIFHALYLSPLRNVPGSFWMRISKLPMFIADVRGTERDFMLRNYERYGSVFVMEPRKVAVCDPDDCAMILGSHAFAKDQKYANVDFIEPNVFLTRDPELNKQRRRQIGPVLSAKNLKKMEDTILDAGPRQLVAKWGQVADQGKICYYYDFMLMTFDIIGSLGFGHAQRSLTTGDRRIAHWVKRSFMLLFLQAIAPIAKSWPFKRVLAKSLYADANKLIELGSRAIEQRRELLLKEADANNKPADILQAFIDAEDPESRIQMTKSQVVTETIIGLLAGSDTSSNTLAWTVHLLLMHPQHLERATKEVRAVFARDHTITYEEAQESLPFLEACMFESLRLRPVTSNLPRCIPRGGVVLQGHFIPDGHSCSVSIVAANMSSRVWAHPYKYLPERFLNNNIRKKRVLTFSTGVRVCPGRHLALMEILTTLANILNAFDLKLPEDSLFGPERVDKQTGLPVLMPYSYAITCAPRFPDRDCNVVISKRKD